MQSIVNECYFSLIGIGGTIGLGNLGGNMQSYCIQIYKVIIANYIKFNWAMGNVPQWIHINLITIFQLLLKAETSKNWQVAHFKKQQNVSWTSFASCLHVLHRWLSCLPSFVHRVS